MGVGLGCCCIRMFVVRCLLLGVQKLGDIVVMTPKTAKGGTTKFWGGGTTIFWYW